MSRSHHASRVERLISEGAAGVRTGARVAS